MTGETGMRWRKAVIFSLVFHSIVLVGAGWLTAKALLPVETTETLIELEFASEPEGAPPASSPEAAPAKSSQPVVASVPTPVVQQQQPQIQPEAIVPEPAVAVSKLTVTDVDSAAADSGQAAATDSGATGGGTGAAGTGSGAGSGSGQGNGKGMIGPSILSQKDPPYPERARRERQEGTVVLQIEILENGRAREVRVKQSSGYELLDKAAVDSVKSWRFVPAKNRATGKAVACVTSLPIVFRLK